MSEVAATACLPLGADGLIPQAKALGRLASQCDAMCLTTGTQLGEAVPGLYDLAARFTSLSQMLVDDSTAQRLEALSRDIVAIATALVAEREALSTLVMLNGTLARRIIDVVENVHFLSALVSNVKIEIAAINDGDDRLEGFAENLKELTSRSRLTIDTFQATHATLVKQLQRTAMAQSAFVVSHSAKFHAAAQEISAGLNTVSERRKVVAGIAHEIGALTQKIGAQIAQCVVALQIGDSTRQRLEHASEALSVAADLSNGADPRNILTHEAPGASPAYLKEMAAHVCDLQVWQVQKAAVDFSTEIEIVSSSMSQITAVGNALVEKSRGLAASSGDQSQSFLADLGAKLGNASHLVGECGQSRTLVDLTAERVVDGIHGLQGLAQDVATMATDMTIIGTNAIVTSYRLGSKGLPLSVIAQHLRNHAVLVADAVKLAMPALTEVMNAAQTFVSAREGKDAKSMEALTARITDSFALFQAADNTVEDVRHCLDAEMSAVETLLARASSALEGIGEIDVAFQTIADVVVSFGADPNISSTLGSGLDVFLRRLYTMDSERTIHDDLFPGPSQKEIPQVADPSADSVWL